MTLTLPIHPRTGLTALGLRRDGRPIWPVMGGDGTTEPPAPPADPPADPKPADSLGDAGKKALEEERKARKAAEGELAKYRKAEQDKADADKTATEKAAAAEQRAADAELRALRLEVAAEKGLTPGQAKRLQGGTREELEADADDLLATFPATPGQPAKPPNPAPDLSQGAKAPTKTRATSLTEAIAKQRQAASGGG